MELYIQPTTRSILVAVDVQRDLIDGSRAVDGGLEVVYPINQMARRIRATRLGKVAFTRDWHPEKTPHFDIWPVHCVQDTEGAAFHPTLDVHATDIIISKGMGQTDGYSGTEGVSGDGQTLETIIEPKGNESVKVIIGGLATDYCDLRTALGIKDIFRSRHAVDVYAVTDAMRAVNAEGGINAIREMANAGIHIINLNQAFTLIDEKRLER